MIWLKKSSKLLNINDDAQCIIDIARCITSARNVVSPLEEDTCSQHINVSKTLMNL